MFVCVSTECLPDMPLAAAMERLAELEFTAVEIEPTRMYKSEDARLFLTEAGIDVDAHLGEIDGKFMAAFVRGTKPAV